MIFLLSDSTNWSALENSASNTGALQELIRADRRGHHMLRGSRIALKSILDRFTLGPMYESHLSHLERSATSEYPAALQAARFVELVDQDRSLSKRHGNNFTVGLRNAANSCLFDKSVLVVEDQNTDGKFFRLLFDLATDKSALGLLDYDVEHGGGDQLFNVAINRAKTGCVTVCVFDTDKSAPSDRVGGTAEKVLNAFSGFTGVGTAIPTPGREAENLIPLQAILEVVNNDRKSDVIRLHDAKNRQNNCNLDQCICQYYDLKSGIDYNKLKQNKQPSVATWVLDKLKYDFPDLENTPVPGFGSNIINQLCESKTREAQLANKELQKFSKSSEWYVLHQPFLEGIMWFFAASRARRI